MGQLDVPRIVLEHERSRTLQHACAPACEARSVTSGRDSLATGFDADEAHGRVIDEGIEDPDRIAAATHARHDNIRKTANLFEHLPASLSANHRLELTHHQW